MIVFGSVVCEVMLRLERTKLSSLLSNRVVHGQQHDLYTFYVVVVVHCTCAVACLSLLLFFSINYVIKIVNSHVLIFINN